jgi:hypothetical protein
LQHIFLKFILLFSSVLSVHSALALSLTSIINSDIQLVEYVDHNEKKLSLKLTKTSFQKHINAINACKLCKPYIAINCLTASFDLYEESLSFTKTLNAELEFQIQHFIFINVLFLQYQQFYQVAFQAEQPFSAPKNLYS